MKSDLLHLRLNDNKQLNLQLKFMIVTTGYKRIRKLKHGDELIIRDVWGAIEYKGEGVFIAGGAGVTPFIAILRQLQADDKLLTTN
jgi:predicted ferric reductase